MSWENELALELKKRDNVQPLGSIEGKLISINPFRVSIKEGKIILNTEQIHISRSLLTKRYTAKGTGNLKGSGLGNITLSGEKKITDELKWSDVEIEFDFEITYKLEVGQKVYVLPTSSEQIFFICDVVEER